MRLHLTVLFLAAATHIAASVPNLSDLPTCALECLAGASSFSTCTVGDSKCQCADQKLQQNVTTCVEQTCTVKDALTSRNATGTLCGEPIRDKTKEFIVISDTFGILSGILVIQRFATRIYLGVGLGLDDWFILLTTVAGVPSSVMNIYGTANNGLGKDVWTLQFDNITRFTYYFYIMEVIYFALVALIKLSLLFFYLRIFPSTPVRRLLWGTVVFTVLFGVAFVIAAIAICHPISYNWTRWDGEHQGKCLNVNKLAWANAGISIVLDGWMLAIPLFQLRTLNLDWRKKIGVGLMFCVGTFVTIVSILRLQSLVKFGTSFNITYDYFDVMLYSTVEINVGIICACLPSLRLLLVKLFPKWMGTAHQYYARYASNPSRANNAASSARRSQLVGNRPTRLSQGGAIASAERGLQYHHSATKSDGITCERTYAVEFGDYDEVQLVNMKDMEAKTYHSDVSS